MRVRTRSAVVVAIGTMLLGGAVAFADDAADIVARVGDIAIRREEVESQARRLGVDNAPDESQRQRALAAVLEQLVDERAARAELLRLGLGVDAETVEPVVERLRKQVTSQGKEFDTFLAESGRTIESLREQVAFELTIQAYLRPRMTADALDRLFEKNRREFDGTRLRVSHVILRPDGGGGDEAVKKLMKQAETIRRDIVQGRVSFAEAASTWSRGPSRREGGDLGWIAREGPMVEPFSRVVFQLPKGGVSEPVVTPFGVHIATVTGVEPGRLGPAAVRSRLEKMLASELVRGLVVEGRRRVGVTFEPGVPHLDPTTLGEPNELRPVTLLGSAK